MNSMRRCAISLFGAMAVGLSLSAQAQAKVDPTADPTTFVQQVADQALSVLKNDPAVKSGDIARINQIVDQHILPYVDFQKTTRLSAGKHWRQATPEQRTALSNAFRTTLVRTYSGALTKVDDGTAIKILPIRGDATGNDVVVRSQVTQMTNAQPIQLDYRLEKTPSGWKIYDLNVENVWLIENYRNQFSQQISQSGIDGLIQALNKRNQSN